MQIQELLKVLLPWQYTDKRTTLNCAECSFSGLGRGAKVCGLRVIIFQFNICTAEQQPSTSLDGQKR